ncbi:MAG TPA: pitrilysin family protein [Bryobacteraceae bacterium]|nr:pitrilysin family protein [Bryobacteraceae bacterium]HOL70184.1 pitrilysin family protein [Bryobacteraceae bacterium]HOQ44708.1 pitrilysin family protein [Bryobacteraceae bacterium]HPQ15065.1 pitrilysin family protein [Bryobacteraceae bacterium]HPU71918.1 pitrilysin family protein [Bryobacteraceae bacterium]
MPASVPSGGEIRKTVLPNGLRIVSERMPQVRSVAVGIWICSGSRRETPEENGICHFIEHMLFKGTTTRSAEDIARSVDSIGGNLDAFTAKELVSFNTKVLDEHLPQALDVLSDLVLHPVFRPEDIEKEKRVILEELKMDMDNPEYLVHEIFTSNFWMGHALGKPILGTKETVKAFSQELVWKHYGRHYVASNMLVTAAGNLTHERLVELVSELFDGVPASAEVPSDPVPATHARIAVRKKKSLEQTHLCLGVPSYPFPHSDRFACYVLNTVLGGGMSSRLFQNIRERRGLAYAVFSELNPYRDTGCLSVYAGTSAESAGRVVQLILSEFTRLKQERVDEEELRRAKDYLKGSLMLGLESTTSRMANLARQEMYFGRFFSLDELVASIDRVSADDVQRLAQRFFDPSQVALTVLGNLKNFRIAREDLAC